MIGLLEALWGGGYKFEEGAGDAKPQGDCVMVEGGKKEVRGYGNG